MSTLPDVIRANHPLDRAIQTCLAGLAHNTQLAYKRAIARFQASGHALDREGVSLWLQSLTLAGQSGMSVNQAQAALKRLANEASEHGWISYECARQIDSLHSRKHKGVRTGRWLTLEECRRLLGSVDSQTLIGKRDLAVLALLLGSGLRREEACGLEVSQLRTHDGSWYLANVQGKGSRVRTVGVPLWAVSLVSDWLGAAQITEGRLLRSFKP